MTTHWQFWALLSAAAAALTAVFAKAGVKGIAPDAATFVRTLVILAVVSLLLLASGQAGAVRTMPRRAILFLVLSGVATGASWLCYFRALDLGQAAQVASVDKLSVVLVAVFAAAFLGERPSVGTLLGLALITAGTIVVARSG